MLPIRWDPIRDLNSLQRELDSLMRRAFTLPHEDAPQGGLAAAPAINTYVKDNTFHLEAELPGVDPEKLDVRLDGNDLVLRGERSMRHKVDEADFLLHELHHTSFERRLTLPDGVNTDEVHARYQDGLLEVTLPIVKKEVGGRRIAVEGLTPDRDSQEIH